MEVEESMKTNESSGASGSKEANAQTHYEVSKEDLPLHCPMDDMPLWNSHPRVYIPMEKGSGKCPYCGAEFTLKE